ncbi:MAG: hypothetical protein UR13_C0002G0016 [Candidatus Woesebacteria bacterium GW2011_GWD1_31_12]|nr:MAG: hypothetical protein UR13_C0002G0016 [Candidatus Woesebacteria bacterium GW2011_GWD1_31_12]
MDFQEVEEEVEDMTMAGSICTRCGKPRIIVKTYEEKVDTSTVTYTITECSDPECQKLVEKTLKAEKVKRQFIKDEQEKRETARKNVLAEKKASKGRE